MKTFNGFEAPNFVTVPREFFDVLLPEIGTLAELAITLVILRETFGWHRATCELSLSDFVRLTGLTRHSVISGIRLAARRGTIKRDKLTRLYRLNVTGGAKNALDERAAKNKQRVGSAKIALGTSAKNAPRVVQKMHQQKHEFRTKRPTILGKLASVANAIEKR